MDLRVVQQVKPEQRALRSPGSPSPAMILCVCLRHDGGDPQQTPCC